MGDFVKWVISKRPPERDHLYGDKLYNLEPGGEYGWKDDAGVVWYRLNCSYWFGDWIEANAGKEQYQIYGQRHRAIYIVREDLLTFIKMKWL